LEDPPTCGKGLAESSVLPAAIGELFTSMAEILEIHMEALDTTDSNSRREHEAYAELSKQQREIAAALSGNANRTDRCSDLPMGPHDMELMAGERAVEAFERFVQTESEIVALLQHRLEEDQFMLRELKQED
jgi:hypothetical protein